MSTENEVFIVAITATKANIHEMKSAVFLQTGDDDPFFCPPVVEGNPYDGHAHTFVPISMIDPDQSPIIL